MKFLWIILVGGAAFIVSTFGFSQIIGSIQNSRKRGAWLTIFTIVLWSAILVLGWWLMKQFASAYSLVYYIATAIGLAMTIKAGKIE